MIGSKTRNDHRHREHREALLESMANWAQVYAALYEAGDEEGASAAIRRFSDVSREWTVAVGS